MDDKKPAEQPDPSFAGFPGSANEPPGKTADKPVDKPADKSAGDENGDALPPNDELYDMTRTELDDLAAARDIDITHARNKQDVIDALRKYERRKKRERG